MKSKFKTIMIKVSEDVHAKFKMAALKQNKTMTKIILETVKREIENDKKNK